MGIEQHAKRSRVVDLPRGMDLLQYLGWRNHPIAQCNNVFIFPARVLGAVGSGARRITDSMMLAAARALAAHSPALKDPSGSLLPPLTDLRRVAVEIAVAVGMEAQQAGVASNLAEEDLRQRVTAAQWAPAYPSFATADR
jgi:malate dehydrogenase (oxaloacetate-decarboxylating)